MPMPFWRCGEVSDNSLMTAEGACRDRVWKSDARNLSQDNRNEGQKYGILELTLLYRREGRR